MLVWMCVDIAQKVLQGLGVPALVSLIFSVLLPGVGPGRVFGGAGGKAGYPTGTGEQLLPKDISTEQDSCSRVCPGAGL